jgi:glucosamine-6-phosphate deaminase
VDIPEVQDIKRIIREAEAVAGIETFGMRTARAARFLNLPFYQTGKVRKDPIGPADVAIVRELLEELSGPSWSSWPATSPTRTARTGCARRRSRRRCGVAAAGEAPEVWLYRGAWQEWAVTEATWLVPLSQEELRLKIQAIFKHQSQKDRAPFPGQDDREFWQRVEARNKGTAHIVDALGLPEYFAMEAYAPPRMRRATDAPGFYAVRAAPAAGEAGGRGG